MLPPRDPPNLAGKTLGRSILRGGFLGFGLFVVGLLFALQLTYSPSGAHQRGLSLYLGIYVSVSLTYGWLRWLFSGRSWRRGIKERAWVRWSRRSLAGLTSLVILMAATVFLGPRGVAIYGTSIQVVGQVVDARTGEPIQGATIYFLDGRTPAEAEEDLKGLVELGAEYADGSNWGFARRAQTGDDGRFDMTLRRTYCCGVGPPGWRTYPPPFYGARMILVEMDSYERTFFPTAAGTLRVFEQRGPFDVYVVADAQTLRLPPLK